MDALQADDTTRRLPLNGPCHLLDLSQAPFRRLLSMPGREQAAEMAGSGKPLIKTVGHTVGPSFSRTIMPALAGRVPMGVIESNQAHLLRPEHSGAARQPGSSRADHRGGFD